MGARLRVAELAPSTPGTPALLAEVRKFHAAALRGDYCEDFAVDSRNYREQSRGTAKFVAEHGRLVARCVRAASKPSSTKARQADE